ncbi:MAG: flagellar basal-body rod protein FlgG [Planctomycetales bacterium]|nr:flagellar basal-body rod protein FlgG [Planctomycetales bacterium]
MTVQALYTASTGMQALESKLDVIANNLANVGTVAYKKDRANFEDLFYRHYVVPGAEQQAPQTGVGTAVGLGTRVSSVQTNFMQGAFEQTNRETDVAIVGNGFFQVSDSAGNIYYSRAGNFSINADGELVLGSGNLGRRVEPTITIPQDKESLSIRPDGTVLVKQVGQQDFQQIGQLQLAIFRNPEGLMKVGDNLYSPSQASGQANLVTAGEQGAGVIQHQFLEQSNVEPVRELIDLIQTQRNFELNSQAVQTGDQMMQLISSLRR